jgi:hypothetical protein
VQLVALLSVVLGQIRVNFPAHSVISLRFAKEDEVIELSRVVTISIRWQRDGDFCGYGQPLDDTAVMVVRDTDDHGIPPWKTLWRGFQRRKTATTVFLGLPYARDDVGILVVCNLL